VRKVALATDQQASVASLWIMEVYIASALMMLTFCLRLLLLTKQSRIYLYRLWSKSCSDSLCRFEVVCFEDSLPSFCTPNEARTYSWGRAPSCIMILMIRNGWLTRGRCCCKAAVFVFHVNLAAFCPFAHLYSQKGAAFFLPWLQNKRTSIAHRGTSGCVTRKGTRWHKTVTSASGP
jgi:hypothetical protein